MAANARERCGAGGEIADDVLREAFSRLPGLQDLLRCAATCRRWRRLITERAFLRHVGLWPDTARHPCILAGIFSQRSYPFLEATPQFLSLQAGGPHLTFDSFVAHATADMVFDFARPLASRRGFLLVRVMPPTSLGAYYRRKLHLAVCGPLADKISARLLPLPPFDMSGDWDNSLTGCTILTAADDSHRRGGRWPPMFRVVLIYNDCCGSLRGCTYSSDTATWSAHVSYPMPFGVIRCGPRAGVVTRGNMHWLFMDENKLIYYTLNISVATSHVSLTKIPILVYAARTTLVPCIAGEEGRLSFVAIRGDHGGGGAELWTQHQQEHDHRTCDDDRVWRCSELTELAVSEKADLVFFAESRGALVVKQQGGGFSIFDLRSKVMAPMHLMDEGTRHATRTHRFLESCSSSCCSGNPRRTCLYTPPVLCEMDWVFSQMSSLTSSRLGDEVGYYATTNPTIKRIRWPFLSRFRAKVNRN